MPAITRKQREAIKRIFDRGSIYTVNGQKFIQERGWKFTHVTGDSGWYWVHPDVNCTYEDHKDVIEQHYPEMQPLTYRQFRKTVQHGYDCLMVQWCGMWLGIEKDGYAHS